MFERLTDQEAVSRPDYGLLLLAYQDYQSDKMPCKDSRIKNQCAVRLSVALERCGISMDAFKDQKRVHRGRPSCRLDLPHVVGATELANYLRDLLGMPEIYSGRTLKDAKTNISGRPGIVYFDDVFKRKRADATRTGDHIDLWTGGQYYNIILKTSAGGDASSSSDLFALADQIRFFPL